MASTIFPLVFKAGIKRDITKFQGEYVEEGDWVRWYHTYLRKMEGIKSYEITPVPIRLWDKADNILPYFYQTSYALLDYFLIAKEGNKIVINNEGVEPYDCALNEPSTSNTLLQIIPVNHVNKVEKNILAVFQGDNILDINNATSPGVAANVGNITFVGIDTADAKYKTLNTPFLTDNTKIEITKSMLSGGICYSDPYLFIYGSNGSLLITGANYGLNNLNVAGQTDGSKIEDGYHMSLGTDKVIYGTSTRGQANSHTLLFWTLSSLVLLTSQLPEPIPDAVAQPSKLVWNKNVISKNVSILSSRCVVECDGLFYWPGTDKFYFYNGMVQDLPNELNQDFFFNNLDMSKKQLVYGVLYPRYKEIWWFYPETTNIADDYNVANTMLCTRAVIYNIAEQTWYDTAITGSHGQYSPMSGKLYNLGTPKNYPPVEQFLYAFDTSQDKAILLAAQRDRVLDGTATSNSRDTNDGEGGGNPALAFDNNYFTKFVQTAVDGNLIYTYAVPKKVRDIGFLSDVGYQLKLDIFGGADPLSCNNALGQVQTLLKANQTFWFPLVNPDAFACYKLQAANMNVPLTFTELYFYSEQNGNEVILPIPSYFVTPIMSFASFSPLKNNDGVDNFMQITRIEPDITPATGKDANMSLVINSKTYAQSVQLRSPVYNFTQNTPKITMYYQGRQINFGLTSTDYFQMGNWFFKADKGAGQ